MSVKILLTDDDPVTCEFVKECLLADNFEVFVADSGEKALQIIRNSVIDLVLLDVMLPDIDGNEVVTQLRKISDIPVIMLSSRTSAIDKAISLGMGGDDYITKPIAPVELVARIRAHLRRHRQYSEGHTILKEKTFRVGPLSLDHQQRRVWYDTREISLTTREFDLLRIFMANVDRVLTKDQLFTLVWGDEFYDDNTLMVAIRRLRTKIEENPSRPSLLHTVWGAGYRFAWKASPAKITDPLDPVHNNLPPANRHLI
ncbi:MAG: response regulator transcription factor [Negativicutes bacterium]|nr:response regulator transcription factor [Negativicutes bacterium]